MKNDILRLIQFIVWYASDNEINLTRLRLVKFLYLADLFFAREKSGQTYTNFPWSFVYYGPYCAEVLEEIDNAVQQGLIKEEALESRYEDKDYYLYKSLTEKEPNIPETLPTYMVSELKWVIKKWDDDTGGLLDYVYFETEPMQNVHRGDLLNFSKANKPITQVEIKMKQLPSQKLRLARETVKKLRDKILPPSGKYKLKSRLYDDIYFEFLTLIEEPDIEIGLEGTADIKDDFIKK